MSDFYIGQRLSYAGQLCTIRYIGYVQGTTGTWLGVEWDDPTRGKHSGEHNGTRYFTCLSTRATAGSFVRSSRKPDTRRSFVAALKTKYASEDMDESNVAETNSEQRDDSISRPRPVMISGKEAEEVGFDKIRKQLANLHDLRIVILDGLCMSQPEFWTSRKADAASQVASPAKHRNIQETCPNVMELDLSRNLFEEWREVVHICEQLEKLKSLRVDGNRFRDTTITASERAIGLKAFENVTALKLDNTLLPWNQVAEITSLFPNLMNFTASNNAYTTIPSLLSNQHITSLTLEENDFTSLADLAPIAQLTSLQSLVLKDNKISTLSTPDIPMPVFPQSLTHVDLSYNSISTWSFINNLPQCFTGLTSLRISHNPIFQSLQSPNGRPLSPDDGYMLALARLPQVTTLNFSPISKKERINAESYYLSLIAQELSSSEAGKEKFILAQHPRYQDLCLEYGEPTTQRSEQAVKSNSLAARLIRFTFNLHVPEGFQLPPDTPLSFSAEIPMSCTAYTCLGIISRHFKQKPRQCKMIWETDDWMVAPEHRDSSSDDSSSESGDGDSQDLDSSREGHLLRREVEIVPSQRAMGNLVDGTEAVIRVELTI